jgi:hypothetical protein
MVMKQPHVTPNVLAVATMTASLLLAAPGQASTPQRVAGLLPVTATRLCFIGQIRWNDALDGPVPRCPLVIATAAPAHGAVNRFAQREPSGF